VFKGATLIQQHDNGTIVSTGHEGLLYVTLVTEQTGEKITGTVCDEGFNWLSANLFCRNLSYTYGEWGTDPRNYTYMPM
jgi:hypothetical protein